MDFSVSEGRMPINADGLTPLHIAALHGQFKIFKMFFEKLHEMDVHIGESFSYFKISPQNGDHLKVN